MSKNPLTLTLVVFLLWGCMATEPEQTPPPFTTPTAAFTETAQQITAEDTRPAHKTHTQSPTHTATIPTPDDHHPLEIEPISVQFMAIRQNCPLPQGSALDTVAPNYLYTGLMQGEFLNFGSFSQFHTLTIAYSLPEGSDLPVGFAETIHVAVFKFIQNGEYQAEPVLFKAVLQQCDHNPAILFCNLPVNDLQKTG